MLKDTKRCERFRQVHDIHEYFDDISVNAVCFVCPTYHRCISFWRFCMRFSILGSFLRFYSFGWFFFFGFAVSNLPQRSPYKSAVYMIITYIVFKTSVPNQVSLTVLSRMLSLKLTIHKHQYWRQFSLGYSSTTNSKSYCQSQCSLRVAVPTPVFPRGVGTATRRLISVTQPGTVHLVNIYGGTSVG